MPAANDANGAGRGVMIATTIEQQITVRLYPVYFPPLSCALRLDKTYSRTYLYLDKKILDEHVSSERFEWCWYRHAKKGLHIRFMLTIDPALECYCYQNLIHVCI